MKRLHVHIGRLTLEGKTRSEGRRIVEAIERRLTVLANHGETGRTGASPIPHGDGAAAIGGRIAAQVFQKMGGARNA